MKASFAGSGERSTSLPVATKPALRAVGETDRMTPAAAWLALYRRKVAVEAELAQINAGLRANRLAAMDSLPNRTCMLRDDQLARELEAAHG